MAVASHATHSAARKEHLEYILGIDSASESMAVLQLIEVCSCVVALAFLGIWEDWVCLADVFEHFVSLLFLLVAAWVLVWMPDKGLLLVSLLNFVFLSVLPHAQNLVVVLPFWLLQFQLSLLHLLLKLVVCYHPQIRIKISLQGSSWWALLKSLTASS